MKRFGVENAEALIEAASLVQQQDAEYQKGEDCPVRNFQGEWDKMGLEVDQSNYKAGRPAVYVYCKYGPSDKSTIFKVSCEEKICKDSKWCFVKNHCGGLFNGCSKLSAAEVGAQC